MRHSLTPTAQDPDTNAFAGEPHFRGLSGGRKGAQDPWLSSPLCNVPLETSLEVAERHRQEAQRAAGLPGAAQRPGSHSQELCGQKPVCGAAVTRGGSSFWEKWVCPCLCPTRHTAQWFRMCRVGMGTGPLSLSFQ